jgi:hypothetical protein
VPTPNWPVKVGGFEPVPPVVTLPFFRVEVQEFTGDLSSSERGAGGIARSLRLFQRAGLSPDCNIPAVVV